MLLEGFNIDSFADIVEDSNTLWTFVPGNNDGEMQGDNKKLIAHLMQYEHFIIGNTRGVDGDVNFAIDIYLFILEVINFDYSAKRTEKLMI